MINNTFQGVKLENNKTKFSVHAPEASKLELCLFSNDETIETKIPMQIDENGNWYVEVDGNLEGLKYGYRASGEYNPGSCLFFNPNKLLLDPYALEVTRSLHNISNYEKEILFCNNEKDSKDVAPKGIIRFLNKADLAKKYPYLYKKPNISWDKTHIYELHVGNFSINHPDIIPQNRGRLLALKDTINYFQALNYNQIELMPITPTMSDWQLEQQKGLSDQWGYNPIIHQAIDPRYGSIFDFLELVNEFHKNGIEVTLDMVFNHTGEFGHNGFLLSYKGLDARSYYRFTFNKDVPFVNTTGCGNGFNPNNPQTAKIIKDSLMFFADICGVDGFRFDLAGDCCLDDELKFNPNSNFIQIIKEVKRQTGAKVSGEPWSATGGYFLGQIPEIKEWNDKHEKAIKHFIRGDKGYIPTLAYYLAGGEVNNKINIFTKHDGATGYDWASFNQKNNYANNENNQDGSNDNLYSCSKNDEERLVKTKSAHALNTLARGIPLSLSGDELWHTQGGNNNGYALSFPLQWKNFSKEQQERYIFERKINAFRQNHPIFSSTENASAEIMPNGYPAWEWININGNPMQQQDWDYHENRFLAYVLNGENKEGIRFDDDFFVMTSGNVEYPLDVKLPLPPHNQTWEVVFDTSKPTLTTDNKKYHPKEIYQIYPYSVVVMVSKRKDKTLQKMMSMPKTKNDFIDR